LIYRWRTRLSDEQIEHAIERVALPPHEALLRLFARLCAMLGLGAG
jgi:hypothetical protein